MARLPENAQIDWDHVYLLGWYTSDGKVMLSSWGSNESMTTIGVVVTGKLPSYGVPLWDALVPPGLSIRPIPYGMGLIDAISYARTLGGVYAFGWYIQDGVERHEQDGKRR